MMGKIETRLKELGITLPQPAVPVANYVPFVRTGNLVSVSGQVTMDNGQPQYLGKVGRELTIEQGQAAARLCAINSLAQLRLALDGDLDRVRRCVRLGVFVNAIDDFRDQPKVANGASDLIVQVLGDAGKHSRSAVGVASLPLGVSVEVEALYEIA
jgi:enamine deaminase RidA (YjgF/YER057c/UK114 family)